MSELVTVKVGDEVKLTDPQKILMARFQGMLNTDLKELYGSAGDPPSLETGKYNYATVVATKILMRNRAGYDGDVMDGHVDDKLLDSIEKYNKERAALHPGEKPLFSTQDMDALRKTMGNVSFEQEPVAHNWWVGFKHGLGPGTTFGIPLIHTGDDAEYNRARKEGIAAERGEKVGEGVAGFGTGVLTAGIGAKIAGVKAVATGALPAVEDAAPVVVDAAKAVPGVMQTMASTAATPFRWAWSFVTGGGNVVRSVAGAPLKAAGTVDTVVGAVNGVDGGVGTARGVYDYATGEPNNPIVIDARRRAELVRQCDDAKLAGQVSPACEVVASESAGPVDTPLVSGDITRLRPGQKVQLPPGSK